jgi:lysophospholipase L1-like esterase
MNIKENSRRILCYGDSNTWGETPDGSFFRYPVNIRWTGLLQKKLGNNFEIIEEGLGGRTTLLDDPKEEGRNGKTYLIPCIKSQNPLDLVILMLGTNDLKERFNQSPEQISKNIEELVMNIKKFSINKDGNSAKILLVSPAFMKDDCKMPEAGMRGAEVKSKQFAKEYQEVANRQNCEFIDIAQYVQPSNIDGSHFEQDGHIKVAEALEKKIKLIFK